MYKIFNCNCGCGGVEVGRWTDDCEDYVYIEFLKRIGEELLMLSKEKSNEDV